MNDHVDFERLVAGHIADEGATPPSDAFYDELFTRAAQKGPRPEWLAIIKEPPMHSNSRLAVGSPTVRVVAILVATVLLAVSLAAAGAGIQRLFAAEGPIIVAQDGSGHHATIQAAIDAATDGDEILIRPGTYAESIITDKSVSLTGDGDPADIVITHIEDGPLHSTSGYDNDETPEPAEFGGDGARYALVLVGTTSDVSGLTFSGEDARLIVDGGSPVIENVTFDNVGQPFTDATSQATVTYRGPSVQALVVTRGGTPVVRENSFVGGGGIDIYTDAAPLVEHNTLEGGGIYGSQFGFGRDARIIDNHLFGSGWQGIDLLYDASATVSGNLIEDRAYGMFLFGEATAEDNEIRNSSEAAVYVLTSGPTVRSNRLYGNETAVRWIRGDGVIEANEVGGGTDGILIEAGSPQVRDNIVEGVAGQGIVVETMATPVLTGNRSCGNGEDLHVMNLARPEVDASNEICDGSGA